jgi:hypothetical protein
MYEAVIWCSATNLFCLFPTYLAYKKKLDEWVLYLVTGIASVLYHIHHRDKYTRPMCNFLDYDAIRMIDLVLSDMSICTITTSLVNKDIHMMSFFVFLPIDMYAVAYDTMRWSLYGLWISVAVLYTFFNYKKYHAKYLFFGVLSSVSELVFYKILPDRYPWYYNWIHSVHHIFGFMGIYFYERSHRWGVLETSGLPSHTRVPSVDFNL